MENRISILISEGGIGQHYKGHYRHRAKPSGTNQSFGRSQAGNTQNGRQICGVCEQKPGIRQTEPKSCAFIPRSD